MKGGVVEQYFDWLYSHIGVVSDLAPHRSFFLLAGVLFDIPFRWSIDMDSNREGDGRYLRYMFSEEVGADDSALDLLGEGTVLEVLIALAKIMNFQVPGDHDRGVAIWFWRLLENLELESFNDEAFFEADLDPVCREIIDGWLDRSYSYSGAGGIFPLTHPKTDQRSEELWCQCSAYLMEHSGGIL